MSFGSFGVPTTFGATSAFAIPSYAYATAPPFGGMPLGFGGIPLGFGGIPFGFGGMPFGVGGVPFGFGGSPFGVI